MACFFCTQEACAVQALQREYLPPGRRSGNGIRQGVLAGRRRVRRKSSGLQFYLVPGCTGASMNVNGPYLRFGTFGELLRYFEDHTGTIMRALIPQTNPETLKTPGQPPVAVREAGLVLELAS